MSKCKKCQQEIVWGKRSGKFVPMIPDSVKPDAPRDAGNCILYSEALGHTLHFTVCPAAQPPKTRRYYPTAAPTPHATLQVTAGAHPEVVKAAHRALTKLHGADKEQMRKIDEAYGKISREWK